MAVSKNRRKKQKKANTNKGKQSMARLIEESRQNFMGQYYNLKNALAQLCELVNQYGLLKWAADAREDVKLKADEQFNRYVPIITEAQTQLDNLYNDHAVMREQYASHAISPEDMNWKYIELHEQLLNVTNHVGYLVESGIQDMEVAFNAKFAYREI